MISIFYNKHFELNNLWWETRKKSDGPRSDIWQDTYGLKVQE